MKYTLLALLCAASLSACAQPSAADSAAAKDKDTPADAAAAVADAADKAGADKAADGSPLLTQYKDATDARVVAALRSVDPRLEVDRIGPAPMPGFREAIVNGTVFYVSEDGKYLLQGTLFDIAQKRDLSQVGLSELRREEMRKVQPGDKIVFAPAKRKHTVAVFTDIECGFCRKMHQEIAEYNRLGIAIEYLAFPRAGLASPDFAAMQSVWCAKDRRKALTDAKNGLPVPPQTCANPVEMQYRLGQRVGLQGTPMVVTREGVALPGYLPPADMLAALDKLEAEAKQREDAGKGGSGAGSR